MPSLGGANALRGYSNYRFHDRHLLLASAESRWPIFAHLDAAVFVDAGTVAARVGDLGLDKTVYGFGVRLHTHRSTTGAPRRRAYRRRLARDVPLQRSVQSRPVEAVDGSGAVRAVGGAHTPFVRSRGATGGRTS